LGNCGSSSGCGGFVGATGTTPSYDHLFILSDTPYGSTPQIPDTGSWQHVSYTVGGSSTILTLEIWATAPHSAAAVNNVYFRNFVVTDDPDGVPVGTFDVSGVSATPLPAALPLFATGLGALGLLGWRRRRKNAAALASA
jgi:hypothetical protein